MFTIAKFVLPDAWRAPRTDSDEQAEENTGFLAVGRTLISQWNDDWYIQFASNNKISSTNENQPYVAFLAEYGAENEVESFMLGFDQDSDLGDSHVVRVQSLIAGDRSRSTTTSSTVPTIWVWDRNCYPDMPRLDGTLGKLSFGKQLSIEEFSELLGKERLPETPGNTNSPLAPRRVYLNNPGGNIIRELILRVPPSQAEGLRELLIEYVDNTPRPYLGLRKYTAWNTVFSFLFNFPYHVLTTEDAEDHRTISQGNRMIKMRSRQSLDFLFLSHYRQGAHRISDLESDGEARPKYLHDVVSAASITGHNDKYWTCLFFNEDMCLEPQKQRLQAESELVQDGGTTDPITMAEETGASLKPRTYALQVLSSMLWTIHTHQSMIEECFRKSLTLFTDDLVQAPDPDIGSREIRQWGKSFKKTLVKVIDRNSSVLRKLDMFLEKGMRLGDDLAPNHRLLQSLKNDQAAMDTLQKIVDLRQRLEDVKERLEWQKSAYEAFQREQMDDQIEEENSRFDQGQKLQQLIKALAALQIVLTLLGLAVQLFDAWNPSYLVAFVIVVALIGIINIVALVFLFWKRPIIRRYRRLRHQDAPRSEADEE